jgi:ubiquinone/menaquinone biosynthesis C-methylase UbiE
MKTTKPEATMPKSGEQTVEHLQHIRQRFTDTAAAFSDFVLARKAGEAEHVAEAIARSLNGAARASAVDLACGPGTFVRSVARHVARAAGVDITPAMLTRARQEAAAAGLANTTFLCADVEALPFADASWDISLCGYALHHLLRPAQVVREMARVVRSGGRVAVVDMVLPEGADAGTHDRIERVRDPSHSHTLPAAELRRLFGDAGLREIAAKPHQRLREFDNWMRVAGSEPGSAIYAEARRLMEANFGLDASGFSPRIDPQTRALQFTQHVLFLLAKKP